jgi:hypothetical protein
MNKIKRATNNKFKKEKQEKKIMYHRFKQDIDKFDAPDWIKNCFKEVFKWLTI